jgi:hypothetical protein
VKVLSLIYTSECTKFEKAEVPQVPALPGRRRRRRRRRCRHRHWQHRFSRLVAASISSRSIPA